MGNRRDNQRGFDPRSRDNRSGQGPRPVSAVATQGEAEKGPNMSLGAIAPEGFAKAKEIAAKGDPLAVPDFSMDDVIHDEAEEKAEQENREMHKKKIDLLIEGIILFVLWLTDKLMGDEDDLALIRQKIVKKANDLIAAISGISIPESKQKVLISLVRELGQKLPATYAAMSEIVSLGTKSGYFTQVEKPVEGVKAFYLPLMGTAGPTVVYLMPSFFHRENEGILRTLEALREELYEAEREADKKAKEAFFQGATTSLYRAIHEKARGEMVDAIIDVNFGKLQLGWAKVRVRVGDEYVSFVKGTDAAKRIVENMLASREPITIPLSFVTGEKKDLGFYLPDRQFRLALSLQWTYDEERVEVEIPQRATLTDKEALLEKKAGFFVLREGYVKNKTVKEGDKKLTVAMWTLEDNLALIGQNEKGEVWVEESRSKHRALFAGEVGEGCHDCTKPLLPKEGSSMWYGGIPDPLGPPLRNAFEKAKAREAALKEKAAAKAKAKDAAPKGEAPAPEPIPAEPVKKDETVEKTDSQTTELNGSNSAEGDPSTADEPTEKSEPETNGAEPVPETAISAEKLLEEVDATSGEVPTIEEASSTETAESVVMTSSSGEASEE